MVAARMSAVKKAALPEAPPSPRDHAPSPTPRNDRQRRPPALTASPQVVVGTYREKESRREKVAARTSGVESAAPARVRSAGGAHTPTRRAMAASNGRPRSQRLHRSSSARSENIMPPRDGGCAHQRRREGGVKSPAACWQRPRATARAARWPQSLADHALSEPQVVMVT